MERSTFRGAATAASPESILPLPADGKFRMLDRSSMSKRPPNVDLRARHEAADRRRDRARQRRAHGRTNRCLRRPEVDRPPIANRRRRARRRACAARPGADQQSGRLRGYAEIWDLRRTARAIRTSRRREVSNARQTGDGRLDRLDRFAAGGDAPASDAAEADAPSDADRRPDLLRHRRFISRRSRLRSTGFSRGAEADAPSDADDPAQRAPVALRTFPPTVVGRRTRCPHGRSTCLRRRRCG